MHVRLCGLCIVIAPISGKQLESYRTSNTSEGTQQRELLKKLPTLTAVSGR